MKKKLLVSILFATLITGVAHISHNYDVTKTFWITAAFFLTTGICFLKVKKTADRKSAVIGSLAISLFVLGAFYLSYTTPEKYIMGATLLIAGIAYFSTDYLQRLLSKTTNDKPATEMISEERAISTHEITEINERMLPSEKWSTTIKNFSRRLYDTQIFNAEATALWRLAEEAERPLLILVMGEFKTGKSTFINTLLKDDILTTDVLPATAVVTLLTFGEEKTATIHYLDSTKEPYDVSKLSDITAEGDDTKEALRKNIEFVELTYPNELLKKMEIVDTPGLSVHKQSHIESTENFQSRADMVLWLFRPTGGGKKSEKEAIAALGQRLKPLAIVNQIDTVDEDEETVDEVLQKLKKRLGDSVSDVIGVSAQQAHDAFWAGEAEAPSESRWQNFLERIQTQITEQAEPLKEKSIREKISEFCSLLSNSITNKKREFDKRKGYFSNIEETKENLKHSAKNLTDAMNFCQTKQMQIKELENFFKTNFKYVITAEGPDPIEFMHTELETIRSLSCLENFLASYSSDEVYNLIREIEMYSNQFERSRVHIKDWEYGISLLSKENDALKRKKSEVDSAEYDYKHSGIIPFLDEPITDFSGKRARLNRLISEYNDDLKRFNTKRDEHFSQARNLMGNLCSICGDVGELAGKIDLFLRKELQNCQQTAKSIEQTFEIEKSKYLLDLQKVNYVQELLNSIKQNLIASEQPVFICPPILENLSIQNTSIQKSKLPQNFPSFTISRKNILAGLGFIAVLALLFMASKNTTPSIPEPSTLRPSTTVTQKINPTQGLPSKSSTEDAAYLNARTDLSLNGMDLDISIAEAEKILGRPNRIEKVDGYDRYIYSDKFYIAVIDGKVNAFVTEDPKFKTRRGIHVGSTYSEVMNAYGTDSKDMYADNLTLREYPFTSLDSKKSLLRFAIDSSGRVDYISIRIVDNPSPLGENWIKDDNGVYLWNPEPQEGERITWSGGFVQDGNYKFAEGTGVVKWYNKNGKIVQTDEGTLKHGQRHGKFKHTFKSGNVEYINWENGKEIKDDIDDNTRQAATAFLSFHEAITNKNYSVAFNLFTDRRQEEMDYNLRAFAQGYSATITSEITDLEIVSSSNNRVIMDYVLDARDRAGGGRTLYQQFRGQVEMIKVGGEWKIGTTQSKRIKEVMER